MELRRVQSVPLHFHGLRERTGDLTLGQRNILHWMTSGPEPHYATLGCAVPLPTEARLPEIMNGIAVLLARHEGLRTVFDLAPVPKQRVLGSGVLPLDVYMVRDESADPDTVAAAVGAHLRDDGSYEPGRLPMRIALALRQNTVVACVAGFSHLVVDDVALRVVRAELTELFRSPGVLLRYLERSAASVEVNPSENRRHQPIDQAVLESTGPMAHLVENSLRRWAQMFSRLPHSQYPAPRSTQTGSISVTLHSPEAAVALSAVSARTRVSRSSVVLAALCAVLAQRTGRREIIIPTLSGNRFNPRLVDYVGTLVQATVAAVDAGGVTFDQLAARTWAAVVDASRYGMWDIDRMVAQGERIDFERGMRFQKEPLFNSTVVEGSPAAESPEPLGPTRIDVQPMPPTSALIRFDLYEISERVSLRLWTGDASRLPVHDAQAILLAVERLLLSCQAGNLSPAEIRQAISLEPIRYGPGWVLLESGWVEVAEVQELLDAALSPRHAAVFDEVNGEPLVAYVVATDEVVSPADAHERCMAMLAGRHTAVAPRRYVMCAAYPADPSDPAAWQTTACSSTQEAH
ncbi:condensation domain-containing protein [Micromonospora fulviviridis]|uniref:Condensation domain-containing protein n=1 Tax=Micromonospora fulviviridis TaxID=47860 RepID=A0ABV2VXL0_9ACTN